MILKRTSEKCFRGFFRKSGSSRHIIPQKGFFSSRKAKSILGSLAVLIAITVIGSILVFGRGGLFKGMMFTGLKVAPLQNLDLPLIITEQQTANAPVTCGDNEYYDYTLSKCTGFDTSKPHCEQLLDPAHYGLNEKQKTQ